MLFTFPSRYLFTIDHKKYLVLGHSRPGFKRDFTSPALLKNTSHEESFLFTYRAITVSGRAFQLVQLRNIFFYFAPLIWQQALISCNTEKTYGSRAFRSNLGEPSSLLSYLGLDFSPFARHYSGNDYYFIFLQLLRCFSSPGVPARLKGRASSLFKRGGFPIRRSAGQRLLATSPQLIAGCYVLHRLLMSRHPPYTLTEIFPRFYLQSYKSVFFNIPITAPRSRTKSVETRDPDIEPYFIIFDVFTLT